MSRLNLAGKTFGRLTAIAPSGRKDKWGAIYWNFSCECGNQVEKLGKLVKKGDTQSCGCLALETRKKGTHQMYNTPEYRAWHNMKVRCEWVKSKSYKNYGGRGITVCERWKSFEKFFEDMGKKPNPNLQLDRIDNNKNYSPKNCRWADIHTQINNRRNTIFIEFQNMKLTLSEWAKETGIKRHTIYRRIYAHGWSTEKALTTKVNNANIY